MKLPFGRKKDRPEEQGQEAPVEAKPRRRLLRRRQRADAEQGDAPVKVKRFIRKPKEIKDGDVTETLSNMKKVTRSPIYNRLARGARFVVLIGDEGTILIHMKGATVLSRQFVPDASEGNLQQLKDTIAKDKQAPITMIIDSVDQSFVQQTLPPVGSLFVKKLIKRRLDRDFKEDDIKGAIMLGREKTGRRDWNFLMVSVEKSPQLILWLDFIMSFENRFKGIVLLSVEAGIFVKNLERTLGITSSSEWKILVSHNKVGGFRQIILRNGTLIFTRLALPVGAPTPEIIAGNIEQEMLSTIEYLKRFGYNARNGLDVYIIASEDVCKVIDHNRFDTQNFHAFSPHNLSKYLGIKGATQPTDQFGDVVLASAIGLIRKNILKLTTTESRLFDKYQLFKYTQRLLGTFLVLGLIVQLAYIGYNALLTSNAVQDAEQKQKLSQQTLDAVKKMVTDSNIDIDKVGSQIDMFSHIRAQAKGPLPVFDLLAQAIKPPALLKGIKWKMGEGFEVNRMVPNFTTYNLPKASSTPQQANTGAPPGSPGQPPAPSKITAGMPAVLSIDVMVMTLSLEFPAGLKSAALFKKFSEDYLADMSAAMPGYSMAYTAVPSEYLEKKAAAVNFDPSAPQVNTLGQNPVTVEISIRGPATPKGAVPEPASISTENTAPAAAPPGMPPGMALPPGMAVPPGMATPPGTPPGAPAPPVPPPGGPTP